MLNRHRNFFSVNVKHKKNIATSFSVNVVRKKRRYIFLEVSEACFIVRCSMTVEL